MEEGWGCCQEPTDRSHDRCALYRLAMCYSYKDVVLALDLAMDQDDV